MQNDNLDSSHLQKLISNLNAPIAGSRPPGMEPDHEDADAGAIPVPRQAEAQTLPFLLQLHA